MQNLGSQNTLDQEIATTLQNAPDHSESILSPIEVLQKCNELLASPKEQAIRTFLQQIQTQLQNRISFNNSFDADSNNREIARIFFCIFNLLLSLLHTPGHNCLLEEIGALIKLYFTYLATFAQEHGLCFIIRDAEMSEFYKTIHFDLSTLKYTYERALSEINNLTGAFDDVLPENSNDNQGQIIQKNIEGEIKIIKDLSIKNTQVFCVDLLLTEMLEVIFAMKDNTEYTEVVCLDNFYETLGIGLLRYITFIKPFNMALVNQISQCAIGSITWIFRNKHKNISYLDNLTEQSIIYIEFFLQLITLNLYYSTSGPAKVLFQLCDGSILDAANKRVRKDQVLSTIKVNHKHVLKVTFVHDQSLKDIPSIVKMYQDTISAYKQSVIGEDFNNMKFQDNINSSSKKELESSDKINATILVLVEGAIRDDIPDSVREEFLSANRSELLDLTQNMVVFLESVKPLVRAIALMVNLTEIKKDSDMRDLWESVWILTQKDKKAIAFVEAILKLLREKNHEVEKKRIYLKELRKGLMRIVKEMRIEDSIITNMLEKFFHYVSEMGENQFREVEESIVEIMNDIYREQKLLEKILLSDAVMNRLFRHFTYEPYCIFLKEFVKTIYLKLIDDRKEMEDFRSYGSLFFSKIKSFFDRMYESLVGSPRQKGDETTSFSLSDSNQINISLNGNINQLPKIALKEIEGFVSIFQLICSLIVNLINKEQNTDFIDQYGEPNIIETKFDLNGYLPTQKSKEWQNYFASTGIYEEIATCISVLDMLQTKEISYWFVLLTFCITHQESDLINSFGNDYHLKYYEALSKIYKRGGLQQTDILKIINLLLNLVSNNDFFFLFEGRLKHDILSISDVLKSLKDDASAQTITYVSLNNENFVYVIFKILFEWNLDSEIKLCYLKVIRMLLKFSVYNALICSQGVLVEYLLICLRREKVLKVKSKVAGVITKILRISVNVSQIKSLLRTVRFNYHELYPSFFGKLISPFARQEFIEDILDFESYYKSIKMVFKKIIKKVLSQTEDNGNFIHFSGTKSGIVVENFNLNTKESFSILAQFRFENLKSLNKIFLGFEGGFSQDEKIVTRNSQQQSISGVDLLTSIKIPDYFERVGSIKAKDSKVKKETLAGEYHPYLFSIVSKNNYKLSLYVGYHEKRRVLVLECKYPDSKINSRAIFDFPINENQWYTMVLTYSSKNDIINLYLDGSLVRPVSIARFKSAFENMDLGKTMIVGSGSADNYKHHVLFDKEKSFQGQISLFFVYPFEMSAHESLQVKSVSSAKARASRTLSTPSFYNMVIDPKKKTCSDFDPEYLSQNSILDLSAFVKMTRLNVHKEIRWTTDSNVTIATPKKKFRIFSVAHKEPVVQIDKLEIESKGAFFIEKCKFEDIFFSVGDVDVFLLCIDLLTQLNITYKDSIRDLLCEIIEVLMLLANSSYKEDTLCFLRNNGAFVLAYLVQKFINQHGATITMAEKLIEFILILQDTSVKYLNAQALFWKLKVWEACPIDLQYKIFERSLLLINMDDIRVNYFKENGDIVNILHFIYTKLHTVKRATGILILKPEAEYNEEVKEIAKFKKFLLQEVRKTIEVYTKKITLRKEILSLCRYIAACDLDINLYDGLSILVEIVRKMTSEVYPKECTQALDEIFEAVHLRSLLTCIILRCSKDPLAQAKEFFPNSEADSGYILEKIISITLNLIDVAFFKLKDHVPQKKVNQGTKSMSYGTSSQKSERLSKSDDNSDDQLSFLKLFNRCFVEKMSRGSFDCLMEMAKSKNTPNLLNDHTNVLTLIIHKAWKLNIEVKELFLANLSNLFKTQRNIQKFYQAPNSLDFIHEYLYSLFSDEEPNQRTFNNLTELGTEVLQKSFIYLLKMNGGMLKVIRICHGKSKDYFYDILKLYLKPIMELIDHSIEGGNEIIIKETVLNITNEEVPEIVLNLIQLLTYLSIWLLNPENNYVLQDESGICSIIKILFNIFNKLYILHSAYPDFRISICEAKEMIEKMKTCSLFKNGGIFFTMFQLLLDLLKLVTKSDSKDNILELLFSLLCIKNNHKNKEDSDKKYSDLINEIEKANNKLVYFWRKRANPSFYIPGYFEQKIADKTSSVKPSESMIYGSIIASLLKQIIPENKTSQILTSADNSSSQNELSIITRGLIIMLRSCLVSCVRTLCEDFLFFIPGNSLDIENTSEKANNDTANLREFENDSSKLTHFTYLYQKKLELLFKSFIQFEDKKKITKLGEKLIKDREVKFLHELFEGCDDKDLLKNKTNSKEETEVLVHSLQFLEKRTQYLKATFIPILENNCSLVLNISRIVSKMYYDLNGAYNNHNDMLAVNKLESQDTVKELATKLKEEKAIKQPFSDQIEIFNDQNDMVDELITKLNEGKAMREAFLNQLKSWNEAEDNNMNKIKKKWSFLKKQLLQNRGIWQVEQISSGVVRYKIDKAEDFFRRRMRLKKDIQAAKKEYLNSTTYQLRLRSLRINSNGESPSLGPIKADSSLLASERGFMGSELEPGSLQILTSDDSSLPSPSKSQNEEVVLFNQIPKEEVLANIKDKGFDHLEPKKAAFPSRWKHECEKITLKGAVYGELEINEKYMIFSPSKDQRPDTIPYKFGAVKDSFIKSYKKRKQWLISNISQAHTRNYNLMPTAVEIFIKDDGKTYFFNLYYDNLSSELIKKLKSLNAEMFAVIDRREEFKKQGFQNLWVEGKMTNFEYLMALNTFAGRSFNDINQYPVFPWILRDYKSPNIDFNTTDKEKQKEIFRDLSSPIGALNERKRKDAIEKYENWDDPDEPKFHYGSHYSNAGSIINFLIRLEPFTSLNMDLQSGKFDQADRLFRSIEGAWESCLTCRGDFRELVPEFYYLPEILKNYNNVDFGRTQSDKKVEDVELPAWAKTPEEFILKHREALESEYVSSHLNEWIDLIFGYKQRGPEAAKACNVFRNLSYEGAVDLKNIKDSKEQNAKLEQIFHLGQTPTQLFLNTSHPLKKIKNNKEPKDILSHMIYPPPFLTNNDKLLNLNLLFEGNKNPIIYLSCDSAFVYVIFKDLEMYSIPYQGKLWFNDFNWNELKKKTLKIKLGKIALNDLNPRNQFAALKSQSNQTRQTFHVVGGFIDNSFKMFKDGVVVQTYKFHKKLVTAVDAAYIPRIKQHLLVAGSKDCRISIWKFEKIDPLRREIDGNKTNDVEVLYSHHNEITALKIEKNLGILVSADKDGVIIIFCISSGKLLKSINIKLSDDENIKIIQVDRNGFIILVTTKDKLLVYTMNGSYLGSTEAYGIKNSLVINSVMFINKLKPYIILSTKLNNLVIFDFLRMQEVKNLYLALAFNEKNPHDDNSQEQKLKSSAISMMAVGGNKKHMYVGYENGSLAILDKSRKTIEIEFQNELARNGMEM